VIEAQSLPRRIRCNRCSANSKLAKMRLSECVFKNKLLEQSSILQSYWSLHGTADAMYNHVEAHTPIQLWLNSFGQIYGHLPAVDS